MTVLGTGRVLSLKTIVTWSSGVTRALSGGAPMGDAIAARSAPGKSASGWLTTGSRMSLPLGSSTGSPPSP